MSVSSFPPSKSQEVPALHEHAIENIRYIRDTMERASAFTAVPGWGGVAMGLTAVVAANLASRQASLAGWLKIWMIEAGIAAIIGVYSVIQKTKRSQVSLFAGPGRHFAFGFLPPLLVAALFTLVFYQAGLAQPIPALWLLLYGIGLLAAGSFSVRIVPLMGLLFLLIGIIALFSSSAQANTCLAVGFGGLHISFGLLIARRYGG